MESAMSAPGVGNPAEVCLCGRGPCRGSPMGRIPQNLRCAPTQDFRSTSAVEFLMGGGPRGRVAGAGSRRAADPVPVR